MSKLRGLTLIVGAVALLGLAVACSNGEAASTPTGPGPSEPAAPQAASPSQAQPAPAIGAPAQPSSERPAAQVAPSSPSEGAAVGAPVKGAPVGAPVAAPVEEPASRVSAEPGLASQLPAPAIVAPVGSTGAYGGSPLLQVGSSQSGIWVTGQGSLAVEPDLVLINIGVETMAVTVAEARAEAARAMAAIVDAVKAHGLDDRDIQTRSFNISPQYEYPEVTENGRRVRRQTLVGYRVSNSAAIKVRDLDSVGVIIDDVADAGGNATRINGINFTIEDPKPFMTGLRETAVKEALAKAEQFARLTGVAVGRLVFVSELGAGAPVIAEFADVAFARAAAAPPPTSISGGELQLSLSVQVVFEIQ